MEMKNINRYAILTAVLLALGIFLIACGTGAAATSPTGASVRPTPTSRPETPVSRATVTPLQSTSASNFRLTILHNNDGESQLVNLGSGLEDYGGVAQFSAVVQREKRVAASSEGSTMNSGVIMVSSGDNFLAGPEFTVGMRAGIFYDALAMDLIGYDAIALGNHDFDFGPDVLADFIKQVSPSRPPFLSSNLDFSGEPVLRDLMDQGRIAKSVVILENGERIGIIGATTPLLKSISSPRRVRIIANLAGAVQDEVNRLEASGVNKIILLSHLQDIEGEIALVGEIQGVDVVVAGGGNELLANECDLLTPSGDDAFGPYPIMATDREGAGVPVVTTPGQYSYLGKLVVTFNASGDVLGFDEGASGPIRIALADGPSSVRPDCAMQSRVVNMIKMGFEELAEPIASSEVALDARRSEVRFRETNQGNLMADALLWQVGRLAADYRTLSPDVAIQNGGGIRSDLVLPVGQIRELDTFDMAPFANLVTVVEGVTRSQFKEILENAVSRAVDGDIDGGTGRFAQISGFKFEWSESGAAQVFNPDGSVNIPGARVQRVVLGSGEVIVGNGRVVPGAPLTVATIDFLARGGDDYPFQRAPFTVLGVSYQQALANYLQFPAGLGGTITAADYPEGGEGRIVRLP